MDYKFVKYENLHAAELVTRYGRYTISEIRKIASDMFVWDLICGCKLLVLCMIYNLLQIENIIIQVCLY